MSRFTRVVGILSICASIAIAAPALAGEGHEEAIASAKSAAPAVIADGATIIGPDGNMLHEGTNGWVCRAENAALGAMCNPPQWEALIQALMAGEEPEIDAIGVSYMLAGEGDAPGVSNIDPAATEPTEDNQWVKEGPHLMIVVPDPAMLEGLSTNPEDPVYVMWKDTPYAHIMVRIAEPE